MRSSEALLFALALLAVPAAGAAAERGGEFLTLEAIFAETPRGATPEELAWSPDGSRLGYLLADGDGLALWTLDAESGRTEVVLRAAELVAAGAAAAEIDAYHFSPRGTAILLESGGDLFLFETASRRLRRLTATPAPEEDPKFSPAGGRIAFVRGPDLHLLELASGKERPLTTDGEADLRLNGQTDWLYWEEIWGRESTGFWWSPDGSRIAFYRFDEAEVRSYPLVDLLPAYPEVTWQRYPKAGEANPEVRIGVVEVSGGKVTWLRTGGADAYLARVHWMPGGKVVAVERLDREQTRLELLVCDARAGGCSTLLREESPTWVNLGDELTFLADGRLLWGSERDGFRHLYLYDDGARLLRTLSRGTRAVASLDAVAEESGEVFFTAHAWGPLGAAHRRGYRVALDGGEPFALTSDRGWHELLVAPGGRRWVETVSTADQPPRRRVMRSDGTVLAELAPGAALPYDPEALPQWEFLTIWGPEETKLPAQMLRPREFDATRRYPVIMYHYGGPGSQVVADRWDRLSRDLWHKMMAQRGYLVFKVDNPASAFFGKAGEDRLHRRFGPLELSAQLAGVDYLASLPYVDPARFGLWGWSGGGSNTLYAVLTRPGVWRAAVAGAPVTDWRLYDTVWTERYLDHPEDNAEGYEASSAVTHAAGLRDHLLVIHGTADDNVHPQNTLVLSQAFVAAGVAFEQAIYPRQKHAFEGPAQLHVYRRMTEFFDRHLLSEPLPAPAGEGAGG